MALKTVGSPTTTKDAVKLGELEVGESLIIYPLKFRESEQYPGSYSILAQDENGDRFYVNATGNVNYRIKDNDLKIGAYTVITRENDKQTKNKKTSKQFLVQQDEERTIEVASSSDSSFAKIESASSIDARTESVRKATEQNAVKAQAKKLTDQMSAKRG